ncbi:hypothetical protein CLV84_3616 [Neolewinella xylanilytica]|uniref:Outer membrane protein with beta-barrel domain n=1 Tax=Neolewinella xylanilytica TaxID=1514080 RepID=A0A2S6I6A5_9BACT|nr:hypothetical protein [Neolewinella xylanilytica]PPK86680.1 hypothetical protein CLV84_3616 [Neolewinella xylanilytica]
MVKLRFRGCWLVTLLCLATPIPAQQIADSTVSAMAGNYLFLSPFKVVDQVNPGVLYGVGKIWSSGYGMEIGHLWLLPIPEEREQITDLRGHRLHLGVRRYLGNTNDRPLAPYMGLRLDHLRRDHRAVVPIIAPDNTPADAYTYADSIRVTARITTLNGLVGWESRHGRFSVDMFVGLGIRWRRVVQLDRIHPEDAYFGEGNAEDFFDYSDPARQTTFSIPLDLRFFYRW